MRIDITSKHRSYVWVFACLMLSAVIVTLDLLSKYYVEYHDLAAYHWPCLRLYLTHNSGVAFSLFSQGGMIAYAALSILSCIVSLLLCYYLVKLALAQRYRVAVGLSLLLGGALGNLFDRLYDGRVTDFIELYYGQWSWPVFNVADMCISVGMLIWCYDVWREGSHQQQSSTIEY